MVTDYAKLPNVKSCSPKGMWMCGCTPPETNMTMKNKNRDASSMINHHVFFCCVCVCACMFSLPQHFSSIKHQKQRISQKTHKSDIKKSWAKPFTSPESGSSQNVRGHFRRPKIPRRRMPWQGDSVEYKLPLGFPVMGKNQRQQLGRVHKNLWIIRVSIWKGCVDYKIVGGVYITYAMVMDWYLMWVWTFSRLISRFQDITCYFRTSRHLGWDSTFMSIDLPINTFEVEKPSWVVVSNCEPHFPYHQ